MHIYAVAIPVPLYKTFHYTSTETLIVGARVEVNFASRRMVGIVWQETDVHEIEANIFKKLKPIIRLLDQSPIFDATWRRLLQWLAEYYQHPLGEVCQTALPVALRKPKGSSQFPAQTYLKLTAKFQAQWDDIGDAGTIFKNTGHRAASQQQALFSEIAQGAKVLTDIRQSYTKPTLDGLKQKDMITEFSAPVVAGVWHRSTDYWETLSHARANVEQALAITGITAQLEQYGAFLLEGITGSGKTEVYLQIIAHVLARGQQVLILVPEIGLTPQTVSRFEQRFGIEVGVIHSGLTDTARLTVWQKARAEQIGLVIGTRSAIFTPLPALGMIIIDEEHDESFKQQDGLKYHARALATMIAHKRNIPLLLGTATPTAETLLNAQTGKYQHFTLQQRAGGAVPATLRLVDTSQVTLTSGLADETLKTMQQHLNAGNQVLVFLNRRGYAPAVVCQQCGYAQECRSCDKPFTYHRAKSKLICHHCTEQVNLYQTCMHCGHHTMQTEGIGTEQLTAQIDALFPHHRTIRIDSDAMRGKDVLSNTLDAINANDYQILVGTQILAKGHHFANVTCVVIMDVDTALFSPDFRATEKLAQLITQISGRAGRATKPGETLLQTAQPGHPLIQDLLHNGYGHCIRTILHERQANHLPPFTHQALIRAEDPDVSKCLRLLHFAMQQCEQLQSLMLLGPLPCLIEKRQSRYRYQLLLQAEQRGYLQGVLKQLTPSIQELAQELRIRWSVDVDNIDFS
ncbi:primosomal protein N' [Alteromonas sp. LMIT006]|jgi:primosomal protein N' (replication factor Y)|uniref:primosomal protein N' n=1 Tax=Alteromonadaceae TaxID=72275 RepID=UPI0020CA841C|nr:primosomal protein N' [Alteromonas sp. LMIT006]UTP73506.1 primosomal protein N' [Alteromonas sp. LMIT006]